MDQSTLKAQVVSVDLAVAVAAAVAIACSHIPVPFSCDIARDKNAIKCDALQL